MPLRICLIRPPKLMVEGTVRMESHPPLGLALVGAALRDAGHDVSAIDGISEILDQYNRENIELIGTALPAGVNFVTMGLSFSQIEERIPPGVDIIAISSMFSINWPADRALIAYLRTKRPEAVFIAGGESTTGMSEAVMRQSPALLACVLGEGEETATELVNAIEQGTDLSDVKGLLFRASDGTFVKTPPRSRIRNVDEMPIPAWDLLPVGNYQRHTVIPGETPRKTLALMATRGCPYQCTFCTSPDMWGTRYYMRSPMNVINEIEYVRDRYGVTNFEFYDLTAIIQKKWIIEFAGLLISRNVNITWKIPAGTRSEAIDAEVADHLYRSGCYFITYAPESGSPALLRKIKKKVSLPSILESMAHTKGQDMQVWLNMILALPDETHADVWKTLWFLVKCRLRNVDEVSIAIFRPYAGSALFDRLVAEGTVSVDDDSHIVESILIISGLSDQRIYNPQISRPAYKVYAVLCHLAFYGTGYIIEPVRLVRAVTNLFTGNHDNQWEKRLFKRRERLVRLPVEAA
ncbi:MAG: B12-binding domain-containing radical SAM protein [Flavobacteriales bacterium]|nr:B12-binding domain-containing radical SAM protein [Flavobacteriales bacterium]